MAWIYGVTTPGQAEELKRRGWKFEDPRSIGLPADAGDDGFKLVFVDNSLFNIMSGADYEK